MKQMHKRSDLSCTGSRVHQLTQAVLLAHCHRKNSLIIWLIIQFGDWQKTTGDIHASNTPSSDTWNSL